MSNPSVHSKVYYIIVLWYLRFIHDAVVKYPSVHSKSYYTWRIGLKLLAFWKIIGWLEELCEVQLPKLFPSIGFPEYSSVHMGAPAIPSMFFF